MVKLWEGHPAPIVADLIIQCGDRYSMKIKLCIIIGGISLLFLGCASDKGKYDPTLFPGDPMFPPADEPVNQGVTGPDYTAPGEL